MQHANKTDESLFAECKHHIGGIARRQGDDSGMVVLTRRCIVISGEYFHSVSIIMKCRIYKSITLYTELLIISLVL